MIISFCITSNTDGHKQNINNEIHVNKMNIPNNKLAHTHSNIGCDIEVLCSILLIEDNICRSKRYTFEYEKN